MLIGQYLEVPLMFRRYVALVGAAALLVLANAVGAVAQETPAETPSRELASS
ncbi:MAG: hypothetical protein ABGY41_22255 [Candidatus Poribacteria bacterium]